jgi:hypothetical protein
MASQFDERCAVSHTLAASRQEDVDGRVKPGHDGESNFRLPKQKRPDLSTRPLQTLIRRCS